MTARELRSALAAATAAAERAGDSMRRNRLRTKKINSATLHDLKLELDVQCQRLITRTLAAALPTIPVLGEEGVDTRSAQAEARWVVDPIDGTVNFAHGIPHAAVSIALQVRGRPRVGGYPDGYRTVVGVVLDPFVGELFTAVEDGPARLNGRIIRVSRRPLDEAIISIGFSGRTGSLEAMTRDVRRLSDRVRKLRLMGSAALALAYVAEGRFDGYLEQGIKLWDIAAGGFIIERAGGVFRREPVGDTGGFRLLAASRSIARSLESLATDGQSPA